MKDSDKTDSAASMTDKAPPSSILETCLDVADLQRAREFYARLFGYEVLQADDRFCAFNVREGQVLILFLRGGQPEGAKLPFGFIPAHEASGQTHVAFGVSRESLASWRQRLERQGIPIESTVNWPRGGVSLYFRDPDGHLVELATPGLWANY